MKVDVHYSTSGVFTRCLQVLLTPHCFRQRGSGIILGWLGRRLVVHCDESPELG